MPRYLLTGGSGRLGSELRALLPDLAAPPSAELDVTRPESIDASIARYRPEVLVHAAAYTNVGAAERERSACWTVNVVGTRHVAQATATHGLLLIHISTDYVFDGQRGGYREDEPPGPPINYYALTKLVAEEVARTAPAHLILRTSFRPREWPYPTAFTDMFTSQDYVDIIAPEVALAVRHAHRIPYDTLHIATERKSVYDLARRRAPGVAPGSRASASVQLPADISLDISRWRDLRPALLAAEKDV